MHSTMFKPGQLLTWARDNDVCLWKSRDLYKSRGTSSSVPTSRLCIVVTMGEDFENVGQTVLVLCGSTVGWNVTSNFNATW